MHELAITQNVLDIAVEKAREASAARVTGINLVIGDMASVVDDSVQFYFDFVSKETIAAGASLKFQRIPLKLRCRKCGREFGPEAGAPWTCPQCTEWDAEVLAGQEFYIESIEVE